MADNSTRSKAQIEADVAATRARLAANVQDLVDQVHPQNLKRQAVADAKSFAQTEFDNAKSQFVGPDGPRMDRIAMIGGAIAGVVTLVLVLRAIVRGGKKG